MKPITTETLKISIRDLDISERHAVWRYLTHLVDRSLKEPAWRAKLTDLPLTEYPDENITLIRAVLEDNKVAKQYLDPEATAIIMAARPCDPPIALTTGEPLLKTYRVWGLLI